MIKINLNFLKNHSYQGLKTFDFRTNAVKIKFQLRTHTEFEPNPNKTQPEQLYIRIKI